MRRWKWLLLLLMLLLSVTLVTRPELCNGLFSWYLLVLVWPCFLICFNEEESDSYDDYSCKCDADERLSSGIEFSGAACYSLWASLITLMLFYEDEMFAHVDGLLLLIPLPCTVLLRELMLLFALLFSTSTELLANTYATCTSHLHKSCVDCANALAPWLDSRLLCIVNDYVRLSGCSVLIKLRKRASRMREEWTAEKRD